MSFFMIKCIGVTSQVEHTGFRCGVLCYKICVWHRVPTTRDLTPSRHPIPLHPHHWPFPLAASCGNANTKTISLQTKIHTGRCHDHHDVTVSWASQ